jgi:hypothetical protein
MRRFVSFVLASALVAAFACGSGPARPQASGPSPTSQPSSSPTASTPSPTGGSDNARLASGESLPASCVAGAPNQMDTVTFVAGGHAWALSPDGTRLSCLFDVADPGPFLWGPLGDRALLGGFEVKGLPGALTRASSDLQSGATSWGRPTGKSIALVSSDGNALEKVHLNGKPLEDITPLRNARYLSVAYHPSGLAIAFAVQRGAAESIWISSNEGTKPRRLVFSTQGTRFGALGFSDDGVALYYAAIHAGGASVLHDLSLENPTEVGALASAPPGKRILDIRAGLVSGAVAWTVGSSCTDSVAMARDADGTRMTIPAGARPTRVLGWLDADRVLIGTGGCSDSMDLSAVEVSTGTTVPLVFGVQAGGVRTPAPTPPPPLPLTDAEVGSGNA